MLSKSQEGVFSEIIKYDGKGNQGWHIKHVDSNQTLSKKACKIGPVLNRKAKWQEIARRKCKQNQAEMCKSRINGFQDLEIDIVMHMSGHQKQQRERPGQIESLDFFLQFLTQRKLRNMPRRYLGIEYQQVTSTVSLQFV